MIFVLNAALFVPIGERIGELFNELPTLRALRVVAQPSKALAANLIGAAIGGFLEYLNCESAATHYS